MKKSKKRNRRYRKKVKKSKKAGVNQTKKSSYIPYVAHSLVEDYLREIDRIEEEQYPHREALSEAPPEVKELMKERKKDAAEKFFREEKDRQRHLERILTRDERRRYDIRN